MPSSHLILCHPLLLLPPILPSIRVFSNESTVCIRWPKYWSFSFSISPFSEHPGLISLRMDWVALLAVQGMLKHLLQHHSSKASVLPCQLEGTSNLRLCYRGYAGRGPQWAPQLSGQGSMLGAQGGRGDMGGQAHLTPLWCHLPSGTVSGRGRRLPA